MTEEEKEKFKKRMERFGSSAVINAMQMGKRAKL